MLELNSVEAFYGRMQVLFGINLYCETSQITTLLGRNGMGKTTTVNAILGMLVNRRGDIRFQNKKITTTPTYEIAQRGISLVPEGRQIFAGLSVRENLLATATNLHNHSNPWTLERILDFFPMLRARLNHPGNQLSGGEQQMLAIGRALMLNPTLLILDEASEGLAPLIRQTIWQQLEKLKQLGLTILLIDKHIDEFAAIADQHFIIEKGKIVWQGDSEQLKRDNKLKTRYLGL